MASSNGRSPIIKRETGLKGWVDTLQTLFVWMAVVLSLCCSETTTTTFAFVGYSPKKSTTMTVQNPSPKYNLNTRANTLISRRSTSDDEVEQTATAPTAPKNLMDDDEDTMVEQLQQKNTAVLSTKEIDSKTTSQRDQQLDLVDDIFKGDSPSRRNDVKKVEDDRSVLEKIDSFLDKPFFDPDAYDDDDNSFFGKFARLVKTDYEFFEAVFVACFFLLLITITKDVLRAQMAASSVPSGRLF